MKKVDFSLRFLTKLKKYAKDAAGKNAYVLFSTKEVEIFSLKVLII